MSEPRGARAARLPETAPPALARVAGVLYLCIIAIGIFGTAIVRDGMVVNGKPAETAANIAGSEALWRAGATAELAMPVLAVFILAIFYGLFRSVGRRTALVAVFFNLAAIGLDAMTRLSLFRAAGLAKGTGYAAALAPQERHALAYQAILDQETGFAISLLFFAFFCLAMARLIYRSGFMPRAIGVLMGVAGASYLFNSVAYLLSPPFAASLFPFVLLPALIGELSLATWLTVKGVDTGAWNSLQRA